jgi:hypothetical protein
MFPIVEAFGKAIDREYAEQRVKWERLYETTQTKGDGEAHPFLSPNDEFADYETWDKGNLDGSQAKKKEMLEFEYTRSALKNGLKLEAKLGTNPYKFGLVGSTDAHTGIMSIEEDNFFGKTTPQEPSPHRMTATFMNNPKTGVKVMDWEVCSAGYAAVWAEENTRASLWDAMQRKETYATTGSRLVVRFFGGWDFEKSDANTRSPAATGYTKGVPMGGDLHAAPAGKSPTFLAAAMKDALSGNLDGLMRRVTCTRKSMTWLGAATANRTRMANSLASATPWTLRTPPGPTPSAPLNSPPYGKTRTLTRSSAPFITSVFSKFPRPAGLLTTRRGSAASRFPAPA